MIAAILGFVLGVWVLQQQAVLPSFIWLPLMACCGLLLLIYRYLRAPQYARLSTVFIIAGVAGFFYAAGFAKIRLDDALPKTWEQKNVEVIGVVASLSEVTNRGERFRFDVEQVMTPDAQVPAHILLTDYQGAFQYHPAAEGLPADRTAFFRPGQRWQLTVKLKRPHTTYNPHGYDFEAWALANNVRAMGAIRKRQGMHKLADFVWRPAYVIEFCRAKVGDRMMHAHAGQPYAGVLRALVIGDDSLITRKDWEVYLRTGINHLMSISGLHITMLAGFAYGIILFVWQRYPKLVLRIPARKAAIIGGSMVALLYACLAGLSVPTQRTLYMLTAFAVALLLNWRPPMSRILAMALAVVVLLDPWAVIAPGFWLSFVAVAIITYASVNRLRIRHWLSEAVNTQWSVTLGLLPFLIAMFRQASIISPVANAFAIPAISLLVVPLAIAGALLPFDFVLHIAHWVLAICMYALNWLANLPFATWQQAAAPDWTILLALLGMLWVLLPRGFPQRWLGGVLMLPMLLVVPPRLAEGDMEVAVLDVGQGLAVVIKTANHVMLYDTGQQYNQDSDAGNSVIVPYLRGQGVMHLDGMVVSHDDIDHSGGMMSVLRQIKVDWVSSSFELPAHTPPGPIQQQCFAGQKWVWDAVVFEVLYPDQESYQHTEIKDNNRSCVIKVTGHYGSLLLTGDIEAEAEQALLRSHKNRLRSDVLTAPHHGSNTSSTAAFIHAVNAKHTVFTVGYLNRFKHPRPLVLSRVLENRTELYRSDYDGAVLFRFTQKSPLFVERWRVLSKKYWHDFY